jgi:hypothetical protein
VHIEHPTSRVASGVIWVVDSGLAYRHAREFDEARRGTRKSPSAPWGATLTLVHRSSTRNKRGIDSRHASAVFVLGRWVGASSPEAE